MRFWLAGIAALGGTAFFAPQAEASSFVTLAPPPGPATASVLTLPLPEQPAVARDAAPERAAPARGRLLVLSSSIVAVRVSASEPDRLAAAPPPAVRWSSPMVIRGGMVGGAFERVATAAPSPSPAKAAPKRAAPKKAPATRQQAAPKPAAPPEPAPATPSAPMPALAPGRTFAEPL